MVGVERVPEEKKSKISYDVFPRGAKTERIKFELSERLLPEKFEFLIYLKYREGSTNLSRRILLGKKGV